MFYTYENVAKFYEALIEAPSEHLSGPVLIFVSTPDADALAAAATITNLLRSDLIRFELVPIRSYSHMVETFQERIHLDSEMDELNVGPRSILCLNCGARVNLEGILRINLSKRLSQERIPSIYVIDAQRPVHLKNALSNHIKILDVSIDSYESARQTLELPTTGYEDDYGFVCHSASDDDDDDDDDNGVRGYSDVENDDVQFDDDDDEEEEEEDDDDHDNQNNSENDSLSGTPPLSKRSRKKLNRLKTATNSAKKPRKRIKLSPEEKAMQNSVAKYYQNVEYSYPAAYTANVLVSNLQRATLRTVWMSAVGLSDQLVFNRINHRKYQHVYALIKEELLKFNGSTITDDNELTREIFQTQSKQLNSDEAEQVVPSSEFKFHMIRHWTIFEALQNSTYLSTKLSAWRQNGQRRIQEFLAILGIPISEAHQKWIHLCDKYKTALSNKIDLVKNRFSLDDITYNNFVKISHSGQSPCYSATDMVYALNAIMELEQGGGLSLEGQNPIDEYKLRFWCAYDALNDKHSALKRGFELATESQKFVIQECATLIERRRCIKGGPFRYTFLRDSQHKDLMRNPLLLARVGLFLMDALQNPTSMSRPRPFIVIAPDESKGTWVVVAVTPPTVFADFGTRFRQAAKDRNCTVVFEGFNTNVIEIANGQESGFIRYIHDIMRYTSLE